LQRIARGHLTRLIMDTFPHQRGDLLVFEGLVQIVVGHQRCRRTCDRACPMALPATSAEDLVDVARQPRVRCARGPGSDLISAVLRVTVTGPREALQVRASRGDDDECGDKCSDKHCIRALHALRRSTRDAMWCLAICRVKTTTRSD